MLRTAFRKTRNRQSASANCVPILAANTTAQHLATATAKSTAVGLVLGSPVAEGKGWRSPSQGKEMGKVSWLNKGETRAPAQKLSQRIVMIKQSKWN